MHLKKDFKNEQASPKLDSEGESGKTTKQDSLSSDQKNENPKKDEKSETAPKRKCLLKFLSGLSNVGEESQKCSEFQTQRSMAQQQDKYFEKSKALIAPPISSLPKPYWLVNIANSMSR